MSDIILKIEGLKKYYGNNDNLVKAIDGIDLTIEEGQFVSVLGASGSGKTTLIELMSGILPSTAGTISIDDTIITDLEEPDLTIMRRENIGIVFQKFNLLKMLNTYENIVLPCKISHKDIDKEYLHQIIKNLEIEDQIQKYPNQMSGGQQQRVAIARALITKPKILLADEPTGSLDHKNSINTIKLLKKLNKEFNQTIVMITHNKFLTQYTDRIITIEDTLELHLDKIFPNRDIVAMKTNNIASYSDVLVTCMRQNPKWILLSEVRSAEAVMAVRNSISSGHYILSTIHADKAASIPNRMYSLLETNQDIDQFLKSIYRYIQLGVYIRAYQDANTHRMIREIAEVTEFFVTEDNEAKYNTIYKKTPDGHVTRRNPSKYLYDYLEAQGVRMDKNIIIPTDEDDTTSSNETINNNNNIIFE